MRNIRMYDWSEKSLTQKMFELSPKFWRGFIGSYLSSAEKIRTWLIKLLCVVCFFGCASNPPVPSQAERDLTCVDACKWLQHLPGRDGNPGCEESRSLELEGGEILTCENRCKINGNPGCWIKYISSCSEIKSCS